jgi:hypothetical protein
MDNTYFYVREIDVTIEGSKKVLNRLERKICEGPDDNSSIASKMMKYFLMTEKDQNGLANTIVREDMFGFNVSRPDPVPYEIESDNEFNDDPGALQMTEVNKVIWKQLLTHNRMRMKNLWVT